MPANPTCPGFSCGHTPAAAVVVLLLAVTGCAGATVSGTSAEPPSPATASTVTGTAAPSPRMVAESGSKPTSPGETTVRVLMTGDVLLHDGLWQVAATDARKAGLPPDSFDFRAMFRPVRDLVSGADLAICHLETPLGPRGGPFHNYPTFSVPPQVARGLQRTGFDLCTTASNHSLDQGQEGLRRTLRALDRAGLAHTGTARSRTEATTATIADVEGLRIAVLSYTYGTNGIPVDRSAPWSVSIIDPARIRHDAHRAKAAGADAVLVALHWGAEYHNAPSTYQLQVARAVTRSPDVALVYGHHAHVVQPIRRVNGTWVVFGLGNFIAQQDPEITGVYEGLVVQFDLVADPTGEVSVRYAGYRPTYISRYRSADPAMRVIDIHRALRRERHPAWLREEMDAARRRSAAVAGSRKR